MHQPKALNTVWNFVKPFYRVLKFFGLAAYSIDGDIKNGKVKIKVFDVLYLIFILSAQAYFLNLIISLELSFNQTGNFLIDTGSHLVNIFNGIIAILVTFLYNFYREKIWRIFLASFEFDEEVNVSMRVGNFHLIFNYISDAKT